MIAIFDYGSGNLRSAHRAFANSGEKVTVTSDVNEAKRAKGLVIPGVGAFAACMAQLIRAGGDELIRDRAQAGNPILGVCVGLQILFESSDEKGTHSGLGLLSGSVSKIANKILPHIGWNTVKVDSGSRLFTGIENSSFYFVHSYAAKVKVPSAINTTSEYGETFIAAVENGNVSGTQFHPEKSGAAGLKLISNWLKTL